MFSKFCLKFLSLSLLLSVLPITAVHAAPPPIAFGELPVAYDAAISPDGSQLAMIVNVKGVYAVVAEKADGSTEKPWMISLGKSVKPNYIKWVNNHRFVASVAKSEKLRDTPFTVGYLYTGDIQTRKGRLLVKPKKMFRQFNNVVIDWLEDDPDHILMAYSDLEWDPFPDIKKVNVSTGRHKTIRRGQRGIEYWMSDADGTPRIGTGEIENGKRRRIIFNSDTQKWDKVDEYPGLTAETPIFGILKEGAELIIGAYREKNTLGLYAYDLNQKTITRSLFHNDTYDVSGVVLSKDGESVIGAKYTAERDKTELLGNYATLLDRLKSKFTGYDIDYVDQTQDSRTILVKMSAPNDPGGLYKYSVSDTEPTRLSRLYNGIEKVHTGQVSAYEYTARDGQKIPAFITLPPGETSAKNLPFIVLPHGGPYARDSKRFDYFAQFFATRGYGVLQMNFRGSEGYGKSFAEAGRNNWIVMQQDVEDGARWLYEKGYADKSRTCIAGWSYGGYAALMGVSTHPDLYKCAIAMAALTDISATKADLKMYRGGKHAAKRFFGESMKDGGVRKANSPVHVAENIKVPVFLAHGDLDENVQFDQFSRMKKALKKAGVKATYMKFEEEDHFLSKQKNREQFFIGMEKFLNEVNGQSEYMK